MLRYPDRPVELFDMSKDPAEQNNLAGSNPERVRALYKKTIRLGTRTSEANVHVAPPRGRPSHPDAPTSFDSRHLRRTESISQLSIPLGSTAPLFVQDINEPIQFNPKHVFNGRLFVGDGAFSDRRGGRPAEVFPFTDLQNKGGWHLNSEVSDEFDAGQLDTQKWLVQGTGGEYKSNWIGRAPSQFSPNNVRLEDGMLKLTTRWEPDFEFSDNAI